MTNFVRTARLGATLFGACALIAASAVPASAAADPKEKTAESSAKSDAGSVRVCVRQEATTGSIIAPKRQCKTRAQWIKETGVDPLANR